MIKLKAIATAIGLVSSVSVANAAVYTFSQTGFEENAFISGSFEAADLNINGLVEGGTIASIQEITNFTLSFSGNSIAPAFTHTYADLTVLNYRPAKAILGDQNPEGLATNWFGTTGFTYVSGTAAAGEQGGWVINQDTQGLSHSDNLISVAAVPLPGAVWLFGPVLAGFVARKRHRA